MATTTEDESFKSLVEAVKAAAVRSEPLHTLDIRHQSDGWVAYERVLSNLLAFLTDSGTFRQDGAVSVFLSARDSALPADVPIRHLTTPQVDTLFSLLSTASTHSNRFVRELAVKGLVHVVLAAPTCALLAHTEVMPTLPPLPAALAGAIDGVTEQMAKLPSLLPSPQYSPPASNSRFPTSPTPNSFSSPPNGTAPAQISFASPAPPSPSLPPLLLTAAALLAATALDDPWSQVRLCGATLSAAVLQRCAEGYRSGPFATPRGSGGASDVSAPAAGRESHQSAGGCCGFGDACVEAADTAARAGNARGTVSAADHPTSVCASIRAVECACVLLLPRLCVNRYYLAEGVRNFAQMTWRSAVGLAFGRVVCAATAVPLMVTACGSARAPNHAVRESSALTVAEFVGKVLHTVEVAADGVDASTGDGEGAAESGSAGASDGAADGQRRVSEAAVLDAFGTSSSEAAGAHTAAQQRAANAAAAAAAATASAAGRVAALDGDSAKAILLSAVRNGVCIDRSALTQECSSLAPGSLTVKLPQATLRNIIGCVVGAVCELAFDDSWPVRDTAVVAVGRLVVAAHLSGSATPASSATAACASEGAQQGGQGGAASRRETVVSMTAEALVRPPPSLPIALAALVNPLLSSLPPATASASRAEGGGAGVSTSSPSGVDIDTSAGETEREDETAVTASPLLAALCEWPSYFSQGIIASLEGRKRDKEGGDVASSGSAAASSAIQLLISHLTWTVAVPLRSLCDSIPSARRNAAAATATCVAAGLLPASAITHLASQVASALPTQPADDARFGDLTNATTFGVAKHSRDNDVGLHSGGVAYSCGSLQPTSTLPERLTTAQAKALIAARAAAATGAAPTTAAGAAPGVPGDGGEGASGGGRVVGGEDGEGGAASSSAAVRGPRMRSGFEVVAAAHAAGVAAATAGSAWQVESGLGDCADGSCAPADAVAGSAGGGASVVASNHAVHAGGRAVGAPWAVTDGVVRLLGASVAVCFPHHAAIVADGDLATTTPADLSMKVERSTGGAAVVALLRGPAQPILPPCIAGCREVAEAVAGALRHVPSILKVRHFVHYVRLWESVFDEVGDITATVAAVLAHAKRGGRVDGSGQRPAPTSEVPGGAAGGCGGSDVSSRAEGGGTATQLGEAGSGPGGVPANVFAVARARAAQMRSSPASGSGSGGATGGVVVLPDEAVEAANVLRTALDEVAADIAVAAVAARAGASTATAAAASRCVEQLVRMGNVWFR